MHAVNEALLRVRYNAPKGAMPDRALHKGVLHKSRSAPALTTLAPDELRALAAQTLANTDSALKELHDELSRMAGRVVDSDHRAGPGYMADVPDYRERYSLNSSRTDAFAVASSSSSSSQEDSSTCPSSNGDEGAMDLM